MLISSTNTYQPSYMPDAKDTLVNRSQFLPSRSIELDYLKRYMNLFHEQKQEIM